MAKIKQSLAYHPELVTMDRALEVLKAVIVSSSDRLFDSNVLVVSRESVLAAEKLYRDATGVFLNVG